MKISSLLLATVGGALLGVSPVRAQRPVATPPPTLYPDSPARANPRAVAPPRAPAVAAESTRVPRGPLDWERTTALSPDGRLFVTRNADGRLRVWELASGQSEVELPPGAIDAVFSPDSRALACRFEKSPEHPGGRFWQVFATDGKPAGIPLVAPEADGDGTEILVFSPDARLVAGFLGTGTGVRVALWDAAGGPPKAVQPVAALYGGVALAFSPDGKTLVAAGGGTGTALLNVPDLKETKLLASADARLLDAAAFSPDGKILALGGEEGRVVRGQRDLYPTAALYEVASGRLIADLKVAPNRNGRVRQVIFANDGRAVVTATDRNLQAWSAADGRLQAMLPEGGYPAAVSPDGRTLAAAQFSDLACWDTSTWRLGVRIANARAGGGTGTGWLGNAPLVFSPDGGGVVTLRGNSAAAWDLPAGRPLAERTATQSRVAY